ncbi:hypothetical protein OC845_002096 [Tilletia horrida]|nr:hypothetical protein OC845_002096 [Tilletia horrida]
MHVLLLMLSALLQASFTLSASTTDVQRRDQPVLPLRPPRPEVPSVPEPILRPYRLVLTPEETGKVYGMLAAPPLALAALIIVVESIRSLQHHNKN